MMGLSTGSEFASTTEILALIDNDPKYTAKLKELGARINVATATLAQATQQIKQAESHRAVAEKAFEHARQMLAEANATKAENEKVAAALDERSRQQGKREALHVATVADYNKQKLVAEAAIADRGQNIANRDIESEKLRTAAEASRDAILKEAAAVYEKVKQCAANVAADKADLAAKRKDFRDFVARMKGWEFT